MKNILKTTKTEFSKFEYIGATSIAVLLLTVVVGLIIN